jgi:hypothetical protein
MGRKLKLKKERKERIQDSKNDLTHENEFKPTEFVREVQNFGYKFTNLDRSPQLPDLKREPEI